MVRMRLIWLSRPNATRRIACPDPRHQLDILPAVWPVVAVEEDQVWEAITVMVNFEARE